MSASKVMASVAWDKDGILLVDYLKKGATITASYYTPLLDKTEAGACLQMAGQAVTRSVVFQDNAFSHTAVITQQKLADLHFEVLKHPAYSPDLAASNYHLFLNLKKTSDGNEICAH
jgi:histone-lysine N-methyltransferase SETMAR